MLGTADIQTSLALSPRGMDQLKLQAKNDPKAAVRAAAQQFEALFLDMMLKSMREATPEEGLFDSPQSKMFNGMLDGQLTQKMASGKGIGLAEMMIRQLERAASPALQVALPDHAIPLKKLSPQTSLPLQPVAPPPVALPGQPVTTPPVVLPARAAEPAAASKFTTPKEFVNAMWPHAVEASRASGIPAHFLIGHAALESGWGQREMRAADGSPSHNLFGIKAGASWKGAVAEVPTTEYVNGVAQKVTARFRAYDSYADAFRDYADTLRGNSRYEHLFSDGLDVTGFARGLQQAGYATDPQYASKLIRVLNGTTLRQALLG